MKGAGGGDHVERDGRRDEEHERERADELARRRWPDPASIGSIESPRRPPSSKLRVALMPARPRSPPGRSTGRSSRPPRSAAVYGPGATAARSPPCGHRGRAARSAARGGTDDGVQWQDGRALALDFQPNAVHAGILTVHATTGPRARHGLAIRTPASSTDSLKLLSAGGPTLRSSTSTTSAWPVSGEPT